MYIHQQNKKQNAIKPFVTVITTSKEGVWPFALTMYIHQQDWIGRATHCSELGCSKKTSETTYKCFTFFFLQILTNEVNRTANICLLLSNLRIEKEDIYLLGWLVIDCQLSVSLFIFSLTHKDKNINEGRVRLERKKIMILVSCQCHVHPTSRFPNSSLLFAAALSQNCWIAV